MRWCCHLIITDTKERTENLSLEVVQSEGSKSNKQQEHDGIPSFREYRLSPTAVDILGV